MMYEKTCWHCKQTVVRYSQVAAPADWFLGPLQFAWFVVGGLCWAFLEGAMYGCIAVGVISFTVLMIVRTVARHAERVAKLNADAHIASIVTGDK